MCVNWTWIYHAFCIEIHFKSYFFKCIMYIVLYSCHYQNPNHTADVVVLWAILQAAANCIMCLNLPFGHFQIYVCIVVYTHVWSNEGMVVLVSKRCNTTTDSFCVSVSESFLTHLQPHAAGNWKLIRTPLKWTKNLDKILKFMYACEIKFI